MGVRNKDKDSIHQIAKIPYQSLPDMFYALMFGACNRYDFIYMLLKNRYMCDTR